MRPATPEAVAAALLEARAHGRRVRATGDASRASLRPPLPAGTLLLVTSALDGIVAHEPGDQTITVQAGLSLAALDAALARHGQWLPVAQRGGAGTVGGLLATAADGAWDLSSGRARERLLGGAVALPDGSVAHGRGRVVKNVAGYDLPRLLCGAHDSLGVLVEATFKLEPRPTLTVACRADFAAPGPAFAAALRLRESGLEPGFIDVLMPGAGDSGDSSDSGDSGDASSAGSGSERAGGVPTASLVVGFCGRRERVEGQLVAWHDLLAPHEARRVTDLSPDACDALIARLDEPAHETLAALGVGSARGTRGAGGAGSAPADAVQRVTLRLAVLPDALAALCDDTLALAARHEVQASLDARPGLGLLFATLAGDATTVAVAARELLVRGRRDGAARGLAATPGARALLSVADLWGDPPPELFLLERVKAACDPDRVLGTVWPAGSD